MRCRHAQITVDDKGVVAIFLFGLPGNSSVGRHPVSCALAAHEVLESLEFAGIRFCAGLSTGSVFCGLVGDVDVRCEYAVMGGTDHAHVSHRDGLHRLGFLS